MLAGIMNFKILRLKTLILILLYINGYIDIENSSIVDGEFSIDMNSIKVLDMSEKYNKKLESHLKSSDFFNVKEFPVSTFKIEDVYKFFLIDKRT